MPYAGMIGNMTSSSEQMEEYYEISSILNKRVNDKSGKVQYQVKWKGWKKPTWEPQEYLSDVPDLIYEFQEGLKQNSSRRQSKPRVQKTVAVAQSDFSKNYRKAAKYNRLKKISSKENQDKPDASISSSSSFSFSFNGEMQEEGVSRSSGRRAEANKNKKSTSKRPCPRFKETKRYADQSQDLKKGQGSHIGSVYMDEVKNVLNIQMREGKCMVQIKFESQKLQNIWVERDLIRLLYPLQLLIFYQKDAKSRGIKPE